MEQKKVVICVLGGVAYVKEAPDDVLVEIIDYDDCEDWGEYQKETKMTEIGKNFTAILDGDEISGKIFEISEKNGVWADGEVMIAFTSENVSGWVLSLGNEVEAKALKEGFTRGWYVDIDNTIKDNVTNFKIID